ncbi:MAG: DUF3667 domain-containing protein [Sinobacteraceae bacterium]|nr:DUF3667 domain-containing protein [Nevskiaceae bacterium]
MKCLNCEAALQGPYCALCGQKHDPHRPSIGHFIEETAESLSHADSRLWVTLWKLLSKPGLLAVEFFDGKRARYLPPIRLYLVVSVVFFLLLGVGESEPVVAADPDAMVNGVSLTHPNTDRVAVENACAKLQYNGPFQQQISPRLQAGCRKTLTAGGTTLGAAFLRNLPKAMFVLLPLFAVAMLLFYLWPRRLYAEHLVYLICNHTAIFLVGVLVQFADLVLPAVSGPLTLASLLYIVWYCWRGMRVFYGNGRWLTLAKFFALGVVYLTLASLVLTLTGVVALLEA